MRAVEHVYVLGCLDGRVTFYSQQVRALNLVYSLLEERVIKPGSSIAIVGGGVAGLTAAAGALREGCQVTVFERHEQLLHMQSGSTQRWIHPRIYDWPEEGSLDETTDHLPVMKWTSGYAGSVIEELKRQWETFVERYPKPCLKIETSTEVVRVAPLPNNKQQVTWNPGNHWREFDAVILAVGFGVEQSLPALDPEYYWSTKLQALRCHQRILISGTGDGALTDLIHACIPKLEHKDILRYFGLDQSTPAVTQLKERLKWIEQEAKRMGSEGRAAAFINEKYRELLGAAEGHRRGEEGISQVVDDKLPKPCGRRIYLNGRGLHPFSLSSSVLNRYLASRLLENGNALYIQGALRSEDVRRRSDRRGWTVRIEGSGPLEFDHVIIRHGAEPATRGVAIVWKGAVLQSWTDEIRSRSILDQTRVRIWPLGWFQESSFVLHRHVRSDMSHRKMRSSLFPSVVLADFDTARWRSDHDDRENRQASAKDDKTDLDQEQQRLKRLVLDRAADLFELWHREFKSEPDSSTFTDHEPEVDYVQLVINGRSYYPQIRSRVGIQDELIYLRKCYPDVARRVAECPPFFDVLNELVSPWFGDEFVLVLRRDKGVGRRDAQCFLGPTIYLEGLDELCVTSQKHKGLFTESRKLEDSDLEALRTQIEENLYVVEPEVWGVEFDRRLRPARLPRANSPFCVEKNRREVELQSLLGKLQSCSERFFERVRELDKSRDSSEAKRQEDSPTEGKKKDSPTEGKKKDSPEETAEQNEVKQCIEKLHKLGSERKAESENQAEAEAELEQWKREVKTASDAIESIIARVYTDLLKKVPKTSSSTASREMKGRKGQLEEQLKRFLEKLPGIRSITKDDLDDFEETLLHEYVGADSAPEAGSPSPSSGTPATAPSAIPRRSISKLKRSVAEALTEGLAVSSILLFVHRQEPRVRYLRYRNVRISTSSAAETTSEAPKLRPSAPKCGIVLYASGRFDAEVGTLIDAFAKLIARTAPLLPGAPAAGK